MTMSIPRHRWPSPSRTARPLENLGSLVIQRLRRWWVRWRVRNGRQAEPSSYDVELQQRLMVLPGLAEKSGLTKAVAYISQLRRRVGMGLRSRAIGA